MAKTATKKAPAKKRTSKPKALDRDRLTRLCGDIDREIGGAYVMDLLHRIDAEEGVKFKVSKGQVTATMAGLSGAPVPVTATSRPEGVRVTPDEQKRALSTWANAARRAMKGAA